MAYFQNTHLNVRGISCAVPGDPIDIRDIESTFTEKEIKKFTKMVGVEELHRVNGDKTTLDLCVAAASELMGNINWEPDEVNGIIFISQTPDYFLPTSSSIIQEKLGLSDSCFCFDINLGCSGYVYGLQIAANMLNKYNKKILLLVGDTISKIISPEDKSVSLLFGDAGTATALEYKEDSSLSSFILGTDGKGANNLIVREGAFRNQREHKSQNVSGDYWKDANLYMNGTEIFNFTLREIPKLIEETLTFHKAVKEDIDYFIFHQANKFILEQIARKIGIEKGSLPINIGKFGNTSSATIPLILTTELPKKNNYIDRCTCLLSGFGVGYSWGAAVINFENTFVNNLIRI